MSESWRRRDVLGALGALGAGLVTAACGGSSAPPCVLQGDAALGAGPGYCLVIGEIIRIAAVRTLAVGQAVLFSVDDNTAVVIGRDAGGAFALSAICTHACCLLSLCEDATCQAIAPNPGECGTSAAGTPAPTTAALICPCHGSTFSLDGLPLRGPAIRRLPAFALRFEGSQTTGQSARFIA